MPRPVVGVLGGMGPAATWTFCAHVTAATPARRDQEHLRVLVDCDPGVPDRHAAADGLGPSPGPRLAAMARGLVDAGATLLCMPCHTAHLYEAELRAAVPGVAFVSLVEATAAAAARAAAAATRALGGADGAGGVAAADEPTVALAATTTTVRAGLYPPAFAAQGLRPWLPNDALQRRLMEAVYAAKAGEVGAEARAVLRAFAEEARAAGAVVAVAACTELPLLLDAAAREGDVLGPLPWVDGTRSLAEAVVAAATTDEAGTGGAPPSRESS